MITKTYRTSNHAILIKACDTYHKIYSYLQFNFLMILFYKVKLSYAINFYPIRCTMLLVILWCFSSKKQLMSKSLDDNKKSTEHLIMVSY